MRWRDALIKKMEEAIARKCRLEAEPRFEGNTLRIVIRLVPPKENYECDGERVID